MRASEIIDESSDDGMRELDDSYIDPALIDKYQKAGYKPIEFGRGVDQMAFYAPDGTVMKIFGTRKGAKGLTAGQKLFTVWADYCKKHSDNDFLPQFSSWESIEFQGKTYLKIHMERLFPFGTTATQIHTALASMASMIVKGKKKNDFIDFWTQKSSERFSKEFGKNFYSPYQTAGSELLTYLGEEDFNLLWDTITDLHKIGGASLDLHYGNFLLGSDGHIVISDPFRVDELG